MVIMLRGLRQGSPFSLPLYLIQGEVTTKNKQWQYNYTTKNTKFQNSIKNFAISSWFQFLYTRTKLSKKRTKILSKIKNATGAAINFEKMTVIPINTDNTSNLPKLITIKEQFETTKILGILFNEDLHYANKINWEIILQKMEKHINKLSTTILSLYGKTIIINTLILSRTSFLSSVFSIDIKTTLQIHKKIFQYIWQNKQEPI